MCQCTVRLPVNYGLCPVDVTETDKADLLLLLILLHTVFSEILLSKIANLVAQMQKAAVLFSTSSDCISLADT